LISREEFINGYKRLKKFKDLDEEVVVDMANKLFDAADSDKNGTIDFGEWCTSAID